MIINQLYKIKPTFIRRSQLTNPMQMLMSGEKRSDFQNPLEWVHTF